MRNRWITVTATAATLATTAMLGFSGAAEASETTAQYTNLCIDSGIENGVLTNCMWSQGTGKAIKLAPQAKSVTNWYAPSFGQIGQIKQANTNLCMEVTDVSNHYVVIEASCNASHPNAQEWSVRLEPDNQIDIETRWNTNDCLTDLGQPGYPLAIAGCNDTADEAVVDSSSP